MTKKLRVITLAVLGSAVAPLSAGAEQSPAQRCYARLVCHGNVALVGETPNVVELLSYFFRVPVGEPLPSIGTLRTDREARFLQFEEACNAKRYAMTNLPADPSAAWQADTHDMVAALEPVCMDASACSPIGEPCETNSQCCDSLNNRCEPTSGTCQQRNVIQHEDE